MGSRIRTLLIVMLDGRLFLYTAKTGTPVWLPLPLFIVEALNAIAGAGPYYFWEGEATEESCARDWERTLRRIFCQAELQGGHAHRFRDTFAVALLLAGVPLDRESVLLAGCGKTHSRPALDLSG